ncbi:MAG: hypothetical protein HZB48_06690, partial [Actinobacteria bacterium]|nr:hypothetical protein [Actinomycetota bacterium]
MNVEQLNSRPARWYTLAGLVLVPLLVAGGFLFAGVNAGDRLHTVKAAVVNLDEPVTIDGQCLEAFPGCTPDSGVAASLAVEQVSAIFLVTRGNDGAPSVQRVSTGFV